MHVQGCICKCTFMTYHAGDLQQVVPPQDGWAAGQGVWAPGGEGIVFTAFAHEPRRLGVRFYNTRKSKLCYGIHSMNFVRACIYLYMRLQYEEIEPVIRYVHFRSLHAYICIYIRLFQIQQSWISDTVHISDAYIHITYMHTCVSDTTNSKLCDCACFRCT
jgi:hypothetical protein